MLLVYAFPGNQSGHYLTVERPSKHPMLYSHQSQAGHTQQSQELRGLYNNKQRTQGEGPGLLQ
jgi:hypothetical protein